MLIVKQVAKAQIVELGGRERREILGGHTGTDLLSRGGVEISGNCCFMLLFAAYRYVHL